MFQGVYLPNSSAKPAAAQYPSQSQISPAALAIHQGGHKVLALTGGLNRFLAILGLATRRAKPHATRFAKPAIKIATPKTPWRMKPGLNRVFELRRGW